MQVSRAALLLVAPLLLAAPAASQPAPEFIGLGSLPSAVPGSVAQGISADGEIVVGDCPFAASCNEAWRWTRSGGMVPLGFLPGETTSAAFDANDDGSVIVGSSGSKAFRWTAAGMVDLGVGLSGKASATAVSADGDTIVGNHVDLPALMGDSWRWTAAGGVQVLLSFDVSQGVVGAFNDLSADGVTLVGSSGIFDDQNPFFWTPTGGFTPVPELPFTGQCQCGSEALGISYDGVTVVGTSFGAPFRWSDATGIREVGPAPTGGEYWLALAASGDGGVIVGSLEGVAFVWTPVLGRVDVATALADLGIGTAGWQLISANAVSEDGSVIVGEGVNPSGDREAWLAVLPQGPHVPALGPGFGVALALLLGVAGAVAAGARRA